MKFINLTKTADGEAGRGIEGFSMKILAAANALVWQPLNSETEARFRESLRGVFLEHEVMDDPILPFDGMRLVGALPDFDCRYHEAFIRFRSDFYPGPRHGLHPGHVIPLGFWMGFDLYIAVQNGLPPTLIARFGSRLDEYSSYCPAILGEPAGKGRTRHFAEALKRARYINFDMNMQSP